jgi:hypothetical protein
MVHTNNNIEEAHMILNQRPLRFGTDTVYLVRAIRLHTSSAALLVFNFPLSASEKN